MRCEGNGFSIFQSNRAGASLHCSQLQNKLGENFATCLPSSLQKTVKNEFYLTAINLSRKDTKWRIQKLLSVRCNATSSCGVSATLAYFVFLCWCFVFVCFFASFDNILVLYPFKSRVILQFRIQSFVTTRIHWASWGTGAMIGYKLGGRNLMVTKTLQIREAPPAVFSTLRCIFLVLCCCFFLSEETHGNITRNDRVFS